MRLRGGEVSRHPGSAHAVRDDEGVTYFAVQPPSIDRLAPDIWLAASEQRNTASAAT
jgi:hypothetical protein